MWSKDIKIERIETVEERKNKETREEGGVHDETSNRGILGQVVSGATFSPLCVALTDLRQGPVPSCVSSTGVEHMFLLQHPLTNTNTKYDTFMPLLLSLILHDNTKHETDRRSLSTLLVN